jgi:hypothetical protein
MKLIDGIIYMGVCDVTKEGPVCSECKRTDIVSESVNTIRVGDARITSSQCKCGNLMVKNRNNNRDYTREDLVAAFRPK